MSRSRKREVVIIDYPLHWGGQVRDRGLWRGVLDGEIWDWNPKEKLKRQAEAEGLGWEVLRHRKGGKTEVVERSK